MKNYISFSDNGEILKTGTCSEIDFQSQGKNVIEGIANDRTQYIENNTIVNMPPKPQGEAYFDFVAKQWVLDYTSQQNLIKRERSRLLNLSDWTQLPDVPLNTKSQWAAYRQQLRDITAQSGYPFDVVWPVAPT